MNEGGMARRAQRHRKNRGASRKTFSETDGDAGGRRARARADARSEVEGKRINDSGFG